MKKLLRERRHYYRISQFLLLGILFLGISSLNLVAQTIVTGNVTSNEGEPLIGASITLENTSQGTVTDFNGNFNLTQKRMNE